MKNKNLPYQAYAILILLLAALGFIASCYLILLHYKNYTDITYSSFCAISRSINCDTVSQSPWSFLFGTPLAIWGFFSYLIFFILCLLVQKNKQQHKYLWDILFLLALVYSIFDIYLGYIAAVKIKSYCIVCLFTYAISLSLLFLTWIIRKRFYSHSFVSSINGNFQYFKKHKSYSSLLLIIIASFGILKLFLPTYWIYDYPPLSKDIHFGTTQEGRPWVGAENPEIIINEYSDYQCFQCSKMHLMLRLLVNEHPTKIRLVHYHYPMDENFNTVLVKNPFHSGSGQLALLAIASKRQDKFWEANDALYSIARQGIPEFNIIKFAGKLGVESKLLKEDMYSLSALKELEEDIRSGLKNNIVGTPSYIIDGQVYPSHLPPHIIDRVIHD